MKLSLSSDPLDIAPHAPRHSSMAWGLCTGAVAAAFVSVAVFAVQWSSLNEAKDGLARAQSVIDSRRHANEIAKGARTRAPSPDDLQLHSALRLPWSLIFGALEQAAHDSHASVTLVGLAPESGETGITGLHITGMAADSQSLLKYVDAVRAQPAIANGELLAQSSVEIGGGQAQRFEMILRISQSHRQASQ